MTLVSSLKNRVFLACASVAILSIGLGTLFVTSRVSVEAEAELERDLEEAARLLGEHYEARASALREMAWLVADLPKLKAAVATGDGPTVAPLARDYRERLGSDVLLVTDDEGRVLVGLGLDDSLVNSEAIARALRGEEQTYVSRSGGRVLEMASLPISIGTTVPELLGTLSVGFFLDDRLVRELASLTSSEVALLSGGKLVATTLEPVAEAGLEAISRDARTVRLGGEDFVAKVVTLLPVEGETRAVLLRSRSARLSFLRTFREGVLLSSLVGILLATILSYAVARTVTSPLGEITNAMREMASTGDLTRKIELRGPSVDEDATLLARTFNRLTDAIVRFQEESASKEKLSALGRMSTVIAHEIRNPLMIIKASLRSLRKAELSEPEVRDAADDIDHEVQRLNRMVGDVLDFARPIKLELHPADLSALCREAVEAASAGDEAPPVHLRLDESVGDFVTDAERLRTVLVNVLQNARQAVGEHRHLGDGALVELEARSGGNGALALLVRDRGPGIPEEDLSKIFEPYFTSKRMGTGLGLAIVKNIVESLGGSVEASSPPEGGMEIRIELPRLDTPPGLRAET